MPRAVSSSSSEDEAEKSPTKSPEKQKQNGEKSTRYQCPEDFVSFCHKPCSSTLTKSLKKNNNELWLIKAPANFQPECFSGIKVPLSGLKTLKVPAGGAQTGGSQQIYSVMASTHGTSDFCLLTSNKHKSGNNVFGPAFSGLLNVCENFGGGGASQTPQVIPAVPAPSIPPGLKQRFHPFGSKAPTLAESEVDGASFGPSSPTLKRVVEEDEDEEEGRKKKKKKKKDKEARKEQVEYVQEIKSEPESDAQEEEMMETEVVEEKRKKKKKKKDRERDEEVECVDGVTVKTEPTDTSYEGGAEGSGKKKKKKKDRERNEEEEECVVSGVTVKVEDVTVKTEQIDTSYENGAEVSGKKKKKKKKNRSEDD